MTVLVIAAGVFVAGCSKKQSKKVLVATTTSVYDTGLLEYLMDRFEKESGYKVEVLAVGSGEALKMGKMKNVDALLVHAPEREKEFMRKKYGAKRKTFMKNHFLIVGHAKDKARVKKRQTPEEAFTHISETKSTFVSRDDDSGTNIKELEIWKNAKIKPSGDWYIGSGQGMANTLFLANDKGAYTITDSATFNKLRERLELENLSVLFDKDGTSLDNYYSVITIAGNSKETVNKAGADSFFNWMTSKAALKLIGNYKDSKNRTLFNVL